MEKITIKAKTRQEIAREYGISPRTFSRRIKEARIKLQNGLIYPCDVKKIYKKFGYPKK